MPGVTAPTLEPGTVPRPVALRTASGGATSAAALAARRAYAARPPDRRRTRGERRRAAAADPVLLGVALLLLAQLVLRAWAGSGAYFWQDDFRLVRQSLDGLTRDFLLQDYAGHLMPGGMAWAWALGRVAPLDWDLALAGLLAIQLATGIVLARTLLGLFGRRMAVLLPLGLYALSPLAMNSFLWWSNGIQLLPTQLALVVAVDGHVRFLRDGRRRHAAQAVLAVVGGLAFYEKAVLAPGLLALLTLLPLARDTGLRRVTGPLRRHPVYWGAHAAVVAGYTAVYLSLTSSLQAAAPTASGVLDVATFAARTLVTGVVGGPWQAPDGLPSPVQAFAAPPSPVLAAATALVGLVVLGSLAVRRGAAARAWTVLVAYLAVDVALVVVGRLDLVGPWIAADPRYYTDAVPVAALALGLALLPTTDPAETAARPRPAALPTGRWRDAALVVVAALIAGSVVSTLSLGRLAERNSVRPYVDGLRAQLAAAPGTAVADGPVPTHVMWGLFGPYARVSTVLGPLPEGRRVGAPADDLRVFTTDGELVPAGFVGATATPPGPDGACGSRLVPGGTLTLPLPHEGTASHVRLEWLTGRPATAVVEVGPARHVVRLDAGVRRLHLPVGGPVERVVIRDVEGESVVCVLGAVAGTVLPPR